MLTTWNPTFVKHHIDLQCVPISFSSCSSYVLLEGDMHTCAMLTHHRNLVCVICPPYLLRGGFCVVASFLEAEQLSPTIRPPLYYGNSVAMKSAREFQQACIKQAALKRREPHKPLKNLQSDIQIISIISKHLVVMQCKSSSDV